MTMTQTPTANSTSAGSHDTAAVESGTSSVKALTDLLSSFGLSMFCLGGMFVVTLIGTLAQPEIGLHAAIETYFASWFFLWEVGPLAVAMPGGYLLMSLLALNLFVGGMVRMRKDWRRAGVLLTHIGIAMLLIGGAIESLYKQEGVIRLYEGESSAETVAYRSWEFAVQRVVDPRTSTVEEWAVGSETLSSLGRGAAARLEHEAWPFVLVVSNWLPNARPRADANGFDGVTLVPAEPEKEAFLNMPGCAVVAISKDTGVSIEAGGNILWDAADDRPYTIVTQRDGREEQWGVTLRRVRTPVPFELELVDFHREVHPRTQTPRVFRSDVVLRTPEGGERTRRIQMNDPLRHEGYVVYQESWGPQNAGPGAPLFSQFAVAKNPSDRWPIGALTIVSLGLAWHFVLLLRRHLVLEGRSRRVFA